jgi:uncharacterized protein (DUF362 family)
MFDRRDFVKAAAAATVAPLLSGCGNAVDADEPWQREAFRKTDRSSVAILAAPTYGAPLEDIVARGLDLFDVQVSGRKVVLKPNLVEFDPQGVINTHPALISATMEAFRRLGAREVIVAEGPGHRRDNEYLLAASGLQYALAQTAGRYIDLNGDAVARVARLSDYTELDGLYLPRTILDADLLVSMPKLKTHHWAGVTLSLKNMFGILPGSVYGWPKNVLHFAGIPRSILDINASLPVPRFNIVDGIVGMEGNGPIQGTARASGVLVFGADPVAVDATAARLMGIDPFKVGYLAEADRFLGNGLEERIDQRGETIAAHAQSYELIESFAHLKTAPLVTAG